MYLASPRCDELIETPEKLTWTGSRFRDLYLNFVKTTFLWDLSPLLQRVFEEKIVHVPFTDHVSMTQARELIKAKIMCEGKFVDLTNKDVVHGKSVHVNPMCALNKMIDTMNMFSAKHVESKFNKKGLRCPECGQGISLETLTREGCACKGERERSILNLYSQLYDLKCECRGCLPRNEHCFHVSLPPAPHIVVVTTRNFCEDFK